MALLADNEDDKSSDLTITFPEASVVDKVLLMGEFTEVRATLQRDDGDDVTLTFVEDGQTLYVEDQVPADDSRQFNSITISPISNGESTTASLNAEVWACIKEPGEYDQ